MPKLTASLVEHFRPDPARRIELADTLLSGLYLIVQPSGAKSWAVRYRFGGRTRKLTIGRADVFKVADAREAARQALKAVAEGRDPGVEKAERASVGNRVATHVETYLDRAVRGQRRASTVASLETIFRKHVVPAWGDRPVHAIARRDVVALLDAIVDGGAPIAANRTFAAVRRFFGWLVERGALDASPCVGVKPPTTEVARDRVLSDDELRLLLRALDAIPYPFGPATLLMLLTGQRRDEVGGMRRSEVEGEEWIIPGARAKNGDPHLVPLPAAARAVLDALPTIMVSEGDRSRPSDYLFTTTGRTPASGFSNAKDALDAKMLSLARRDALDAGRDPADVTIPQWRLHDLRRTVATGLARLGVQPHVVEAVLNHRSGVVSGVAKIYNRHSYRDEKRDALARWAAHVEGLTRPCATRNPPPETTRSG